ncbi:3-methyladenine DNA glycosylase [Brevibacillus panacihumi W25]|uniref:DNA-3-methyladenine glycosylase II n=1 Tax=Brevibacillus panacihumi W25 TaxID=1408254 RepID=V6MC76_9BACL|nr:DNA-3-methyladenine glycosylase [Brevibacillus panacihumi]EST55862.1 3-methyladenine DNA glycosylase [Brevibacillus panacihumi W25]
MGPVRTKFFEFTQDEVDYLTKADPQLGSAMARLGKIERVIIPDLFAALIHAIVGQLISAKAAATVWERMQNRLGEISAHNLARQTIDEIQACGLTMKKANCIHAISSSIAEGAFLLEEVRDLSDREVIQKLTQLHGVGTWTAEMLLINCLERRDVVSWGDIAIRRGMMKLYGLDSITKEQFEKYRHRYSPLGSIASIYLWEISFA